MLTLTSSGRLWHDDCTSLANWTTVAEGAAVIDTATPSYIRLESDTNVADRCAMFYNTHLPDDGKWVARTRSIHGASYTVWLGLNSLYILPSAGVPAATDFNRAAGTNDQPILGAYNFFGHNQFCYWNGANMDAVNWPVTGEPWWVHYIYEAESVGVGSQTHRARLFSDATASLLLYANKAATSRSANRCWLGISGIYNTGPQNNFGEAYVDYSQAFVSLDITVTGLDTGNAVRIYNRNGTLLQSAVEAGGTATLNMRGVVGFDLNTCPDTSWGGFRGTIVPYEDNSYAKPLGIYRSNSIWGGDEYAFAGSTNKHRKPHSTGARR